MAWHNAMVPGETPSASSDHGLFGFSLWGGVGWGWGGAVLSALDSPKVLSEFGDYWPSGDARPIHLKEGEPVLKALQSLAATLHDHRVDILVDNKALLHAWERQGCKNPRLAGVLKESFILSALTRTLLTPHLDGVPGKMLSCPLRLGSIWRKLLAHTALI